MHYLSSDGQPGLHLLSRRGHHCAEDGERAYGAASQKFARRFRRPTDRIPRVTSPRARVCISRNGK